MEDQPSFTFSAGWMQQDTASSSDTSSETSMPYSSTSSSLAITHDTSRVKYRLNELNTFARRLEEAASNILPNRSRDRYNDVHVLLLRWEQDDMGVSSELDDLASMLKIDYGFNTEIWLIPKTQPHLALTGKALEIVQNVGKDGNLLMIYYAGNGRMNGSRQPLWTCTTHSDSPSLQWSAIQTIFEQASADVLLLLDCCAGAGIVAANGHCNSVTETIAACCLETWAPQPSRHSFTNILTSILEKWRTRQGFTAAMLHSEILNRMRRENTEERGKMNQFECQRMPVHIINTKRPRVGSIELCRRQTRPIVSSECTTSTDESKKPTPPGTANVKTQQDCEPSGSESNNTTQHSDSYNSESLTRVLSNGNTALPHVLVSLAIEEEQLHDFEDCRRWLQRFPALAKYASVEGMYKSTSTLLILRLPVVIWDWIPDDNACSFIGFVDTPNLVVNADQIPRVDSLQVERGALDKTSSYTRTRFGSQSSTHGINPRPPPPPLLQSLDATHPIIPPIIDRSHSFLGKGFPTAQESMSSQTLSSASLYPRSTRRRREYIDKQRPSLVAYEYQPFFQSSSRALQGKVEASSMNTPGFSTSVDYLSSPRSRRARQRIDLDDGDEFENDLREPHYERDLYYEREPYYTGVLSSMGPRNQTLPISPIYSTRNDSQYRKLTSPLISQPRRPTVSASTPETTYRRPNIERVHCRQCESRPEGFRGEHELRRHMDREHPVPMKKWICSQPSDSLGLAEPIVPLSKCRACSQQKTYGAYYNAAAHLRRSHFSPRMRDRKRNKPQLQGPAENRGAKGGGDWPSMSELKNWMKEVEIGDDTTRHEPTMNDIAASPNLSPSSKVDEGDSSDSLSESDIDIYSDTVQSKSELLSL